MVGGGKDREEMSKVELTEYKCDICGKVVREEIDNGRKTKPPFKKVDMPVKAYDCEGRNYSKRMGTVDMCEDCFEKYWEYVQGRYEASDCYGITVKVKGE